ncbi:DUF3298 and DUF4163 domain-containing protein [Effusibacillus consociatus]|uniref:DUF3298 and DUF4163 domain-containing protein n=1 Tax=Effusibacillus consociatus TaxID=1117041 RepID=A0ABV9Q305_9BACL
MILNELPVSIKTYRITMPKLNILYPVIEELANSIVQQRINNTILNEVNLLLHLQGYPQKPKTEWTGHYEIKTNERGTISLSLFNYAFSGGAHGLTLQKSLTFDVETGKLYTLQDLFVHDLDYVGSLSDIIEQQIKGRNIPLLFEFKTIRPDQDFYIADKSLVVYFQVNEITEYVYGFQYFPISVYTIQNIINEQPLGKMIY